MRIAHYLEGIVALLAAGLAALTIGGWLVTRRRTARGGSGGGQVIGTRVRHGITGPPGYTYWTSRHALVRYLDGTGQPHVMEARTDYPEGAQVRLVYDPARPDRAAEPTSTGELRGAAICLAVAIGLTAAILLT